MLKGIDPLLSGKLLKMLDELGHGDRLVIADRNFPAFTQGLPVVRVDVERTSRVLDAILSVFPLDTFVDNPLERMSPQEGPDPDSAAQREVLETANRHDQRNLTFGVLPRQAFYARAKQAHAIVQTRETAPYCDFILTKGVV